MYKTRGETQTGEMFGYYYTSSTGQTAQTEYRSGRQTGSDLSWAKGVATPNFHERISKGELIPFTPWEQFQVNAWISEAGQYEFVENATGNKFWWDQWLPPFEWIIDNKGTLYPYYSDANGDALCQAAAASIYGRSFDALTFLAELKDVHRMFKGMSSRILKLLKSPNLDRILNQWLEGRYGWRPLINDFNNLNEALANLKGERERLKQRVGYTNVVNETTLVASYGGALSCDLYTFDTVEASVRGNVICDIALPTFTFSKAITAWEVIPLSFVLDWFISVGKSLETMEFLNLTQEYTAAWGGHIVLTREVASDNWQANGNVSMLKGQFGAKCNTEYTFRGPKSLSTIPQLRTRFDLAKGIDLFAIIKQRAFISRR
jgi:hypothetical protein